MGGQSDPRMRRMMSWHIRSTWRDESSLSYVVRETTRDKLLHQGRPTREARWCMYGTENQILISIFSSFLLWSESKNSLSWWECFRQQTASKTERAEECSRIFVRAHHSPRRSGRLVVSQSGRVSCKINTTGFQNTSKNNLDTARQSLSSLRRCRLLDDNRRYALKIHPHLRRPLHPPVYCRSYSRLHVTRWATSKKLSATPGRDEGTAGDSKNNQIVVWLIGK